MSKRDSVRPMLRRLLAAGALALSAALLPAQHLDWVRQFGAAGNTRSDLGRAVGADSSGAGYVAGSVSGVLPGQVSNGSSDAYLRKYLADGTEAWTVQFGTSTVDDVVDVAVAATGVFVAGRTVGVFGGTSVAPGNSDVFVAKFDFSGTLLWVSQVPAPTLDVATALHADEDLVVISGWARPFPIVSPFEDDGLVAALDPATGALLSLTVVDGDPGKALILNGVGRTGSMVYAGGSLNSVAAPFGAAAVLKRFPILAPGSGLGPATDLPGLVSGLSTVTSLEADASGIVLSNGSSLRRIHGEDATTMLTVSAGLFIQRIVLDGATIGLAGFSGNPTDAVVALRDRTTLAQAWIRTFGTSWPAFATGVTLRGGLVWSSGATDGDLSDLLGATPSLFGREAFVRTYAGDGTEGWTRSFGAIDPANDNAQAVDAGGCVYVGGSTDGTLPGQVNAGSTDAFLRKYAADGTVAWETQFGTAGAEVAVGVAVWGNAVYVAGRAGGNLSPPASPFLGVLFVRQYDLDGNVLQTVQFGGTVSSLTVIGLCADAAGVTVAGYTSVALPGQTHHGLNDGFVVRYDHALVHQGTDQFGSAGNEIVAEMATDGVSTYIGGQVFAPAAGISDAFVRAYGPAGFAWEQVLATAGHDDVRGLAASGAGVHVLGVHGSSLIRIHTLDSGTGGVLAASGSVAPGTVPAGLAAFDGALYLGGYRINAATGYDATVMKLDLLGAPLWERSFGTLDTDLVLDIAVDRSGIYVGGYTQGTFSGQTSAGGTDAFTARLISPDIAVTPVDFDFGEVADNASAGQVITVTNDGIGELHVDSIVLIPVAGSGFSMAITSGHTLPAVLAPLETLDVKVTFAPPAPGTFAATVRIGSSDADEGFVDAAVAGTGVPGDVPPLVQIQNILAYFDAEVAGGRLIGLGPGSSAGHRKNALRNMIEAAGDLIEQSLVLEACEQLRDAMNRADGAPKPPDFAGGPAAPALVTMIQDLRTSLGCP